MLTLPRCADGDSKIMESDFARRKRYSAYKLMNEKLVSGTTNERRINDFQKTKFQKLECET